MLPDGYELRSLQREAAAALAASYRRNRDHLVAVEPARTERFYTDDGQAADVANQLEAEAGGRRYGFLLWHEGDVVGRLNVDNVVRGVLQSCTLGYWLDHEHLGRGLATEMVRFAVEKVGAVGLHRIEAGTLRDNDRSQAVLRRAGFEQIGMAPKLLFIAGKWQDHVLFQIILNDDPPRA